MERRKSRSISHVSSRYYYLSFQLDLKLAHKALILVAVPLAFELIFVGTLAVLLKQSEAETFKERHARAMVAESNSLLKNFMDGGILIHLYASTKKESFLQRQQEICEEIPQQFRSLKLMAADSPRTKESVERLESACRKGLELMTSANMLKGGDGAAMNWAGSNDELATTTEQLISGLRQFVKEQEQAEQVDSNAESRARMAVSQWLYFGVALNILLAVALALYFNRGTTRRLMVLVDNTRRLSNGQQLQDPLPGKDEIALLDAVFHDMVNKLDEVSQRKQELVSMVTHDLRTPLTSIRSTMTLLTEGALGELPPRVMKKLTAAETSAQRLISLINDLLDIEKLEAGKMKVDMRTISLGDIFQSSIDSVASFADESKIELESMPAEIEVSADGDRIVQVVINLLSNAIKFSPAGAKVTLEAETLSDKNLVEVRIIDRGRGIPAEFCGKVFERFQQVDPNNETERKGTGLGLPICKAIVEAHGGDIGVRSKMGEGSTFWFQLRKSKAEPTNTDGELKGEIKTVEAG